MPLRILVEIRRYHSQRSLAQSLVPRHYQPKARPSCLEAVLSAISGYPRSIVEAWRFPFLRLKLPHSHPIPKGERYASRAAGELAFCWKFL
jgi:hypothetical protein